MRIKSVLLENYAGIKSGLGEDSIYIDFSKCKHKLTVIIGVNGTGKSTISDALSPLPDSNDCFIKKKPARKIIEYYADDGITIYKIEYVHGIKSNEERENTKGYFYKIINNEVLNLNSNGNITSCKDIVFDEFRLDANFLTLTKLSGNDRGLADKKPADRKKYVSSIVDGVEVYNNMNKTINKRSSVFKSMINSITSKINSIGNKEVLEASLISLENRILENSNRKDFLIQTIANAKSTISLLDPELKIQAEYDNIIKALDSVQNEVKNTENQISILLNSLSLSSADNVKSIYDKIRKDISNLEVQIQIIESNTSIKLINREEEYKQLTSKIAKLNSLTNESNYLEMKNSIQIYRDKLVECEAILKSIGVNVDNMLTKDEYILGINALKEIKDTIDTFKSFTDYNIMQKVVSEYIPNNIYPDIDKINSNLKYIETDIHNLEKEYAKYESLNNVASKLTMRPKECDISSCQFIKDSIEAAGLNPFDKMQDIAFDLLASQDAFNEEQYRLTEAENIIKCINYLKSLYRNLNSYSSILKKLPLGDIFGDISKFTSMILNGYKFDEINTIYEYMQYANIIEEYNIIKDNLYKLEVDFKLHESKSSIIDEITNDIDSLNMKLDAMTEEINKSNESLLNMKKELSNLKSLENNYILLDSLITKLETTKSDKNTLYNRFLSIKDNMSKIKESIDIVNKTEIELNSVNTVLTQVSSDRDKIKHGLGLLEDYKAELEEYNLKYEKIETIKYYSSPTKEGIQLVFMNLYMYKTLSIANELLSLLFNGVYTLDKFVINEDEFRIPCKGEGKLPVDDISSMSTSEICMISMIISFSLWYQVSTVYNIPRLDEIDGGLDKYNRASFPFLIEKVLDIMNIEHCTIISHNNESNFNNVDTILLRQPPNVSIGNVIYRHD